MRDGSLTMQGRAPFAGMISAAYLTAFGRREWVELAEQYVFGRRGPSGQKRADFNARVFERLGLNLGQGEDAFESEIDH